MRIATTQEIKQEIANKVYLCVNTLAEAESSSPTKFYKLIKQFCVSYFNFQEELSLEEIIDYLHHHRADRFINHKIKEDLISILELVIKSKYSNTRINFKDIKSRFLTLVSEVKGNLLDIKIKELSIFEKIKVKILAKRAKVLIERIHYLTETSRNFKRVEKNFVKLENLYSRIKDYIEVKERYEFDKKISNVRKLIRKNLENLR